MKEIEKSKFRSKRIGGDRDDFKVEVEAVPVRIHRSWKDRVYEAVMIAVITITATLAATMLASFL